MEQLKANTTLWKVLSENLKELNKELPLIGSFSNDAKRKFSEFIINSVMEEVTGKTLDEYNSEHGSTITASDIVKGYQDPKISVGEYNPSEHFPTNTFQEKVNLKLHITMAEDDIEAILKRKLSVIGDWERTGTSPHQYIMIVRTEVCNKYRNIITQKLGFKLVRHSLFNEDFLTIYNEAHDDSIQKFRFRKDIHAKLATCLTNDEIEQKLKIELNEPSNWKYNPNIDKEHLCYCINVYHAVCSRYTNVADKLGFTIVNLGNVIDDFMNVYIINKASR